MSTALYSVRCSLLDATYVPERPHPRVAASLKTYRGKQKAPLFAEHFPKSVKLFSEAEGAAAVAAARACVQRGEDELVLRAVEHHLQHGLKQQVLEGVDVGAALAKMRASSSVATEASPRLLGQRCLYWAHLLLHLADPKGYVAPALTQVKLVVTTAYSVTDSPIPTFVEDQHTLAFRIFALLPGARPIVALTGNDGTDLSTGKDVRLDPAHFFESFDATKPKPAKEQQTATFGLTLLPSLVGELKQGATWDTTWAGRR
jgi:hypothetical protein